jgi:hypothetical protein
VPVIELLAGIVCIALCLRGLPRRLRGSGGRARLQNEYIWCTLAASHSRCCSAVCHKQLPSTDFHRIAQARRRGLAMKNAKRLRCTSAAAPDCYSAQSVRHAPAGAGDGSILALRLHTCVLRAVLDAMHGEPSKLSKAGPPRRRAAAARDGWKRAQTWDRHGIVSP